MKNENKGNLDRIYDIFRPKKMSEIFGNEEVVQFCSNSVKKHIIPSLLILNGSYGSGKTTLARLYAKSINCESNIDALFKPCGICDTCMTSDQYLYEINASNSKLDIMRDIIDDAQYKPGSGKFKIFILDEMQMATSKSISTLLKILEEPPTHVKFICVTTNAEMLPDSFMSRAITFTFVAHDKNTMINSIDKLLNKKELLNLDCDTTSIKNRLIELINKNIIVSYRSVVNTIIRMLISDSYYDNEEQYCYQFISMVTDKNINLKKKADMLHKIISNFNNINALLQNLFNYFMRYVLEDNNKEALKISEMIVEYYNIASYNYNGLLVLISKIHFLL